MIKYRGISTLEILEDAKNYNSWIASEILKHVTSPTLEIGAGTGNLSKYFIENKELHLTDVDQGLVQKLKQKFAKHKHIKVDTLDIAAASKKKFLNYFSTIYLVNVLEHIQDDSKALKNIYTMLKKGGTLLLLVPAKKMAYTKLDKELGHYRRYEKDELIELLATNNYKIEKIYFFNIVGVISWKIRGFVNRKNVHLKPYQIRIFDSIVPFLRIIESNVRPPIGISLIVVAKKT